MPPDSQPSSASTGYLAYLFTHGAWFLAFGVQVVLFPYLVRVVLEESEVRFGFAQMCLQLPTMLLILIGGFVADWAHPRRVVVIAYSVAVLAFLGLGLLVLSGQLSYGLIIAYALISGAIGAFAIPARDSLLSLVAPTDGPGGLQKAVGMAGLAQFTAQILGMAYAASAPLIGVGPMLLSLSALLAVAAGSALLIRPRPAEKRDLADGAGFVSQMIVDIGGGLRAAAASPVISAAIICSIAIGICFMGSFFVLLPLIVQDIFQHHADTSPEAIASGLAIFSLCFWTGSTVSALFLVRRPPLKNPGAVYLFGLATGGTILLFCAIPMEFPVLCALNLLWGLGGGVSMTLGRGIVQQHAPPESRGRILSVFTLGFMGAAPIGAVVYGFLAHAIGPRLSILIPGFLMLAIVAGVYFLTPLARQPAEAPA